MAHVRSQVVVKAPLQTVWQLAQDSENFPKIMEDLEAVYILEQDAVSDRLTHVVSEWHGRIPAFNRKVTWTEEEFWNSVDHTCSFKQIEGDFTEYTGIWSFQAVPDGVLVELSIDYVFEVPLIGPIIGKVVQKLMTHNSNNMLMALKAEAERNTCQ